MFDKKFQNILVSIILFVFVKNAEANLTNITEKNINWLTSCRPCADTLYECSQCFKDACVQCVLEIPYTSCLNCMNDLIDLPSNFNCDSRMSYHQAVCKIHCRMNNGFTITSRDGFCDEYTGRCVCTSIALPTTPHPLFNRTTASPCEYKIKFEKSSSIEVIPENISTFKPKILVEPNRPDLCTFRDRIKVKVRTKQFSAIDGSDYLGVSTDLEFNSSKTWHELKIDINNDRIIEPFEFFTIDIESVTPDIIPIATPRKIIYIEDDDYNSPNGIADDDITDVFDYDEASSFIYLMYKDKFNQDINFPDPNSIYPNNGGITTSQDRLKIVMQIIGFYTINIHTIEVNNPHECNLNSFNLRRLNSNMQPYEELMNSFVLNNRPIIDVNYYKGFQNLGIAGDSPDYLEINLLNTKDGRGVTKCEFRAFASKVYD
ncbi:unnamed protein product [Brachionus calyciflorus]|uniref:Calx-beta domain-containing protein n=1 Tax=Brachionus calyciflorus TaxID=104777 RepID=A0A813T5L4_9BILA|nr:unnamed protein product [Brachionus calyciflorus]